LALVKPFRAVRPTRDKVALVTTRSYDIYTEKELKSILTSNPYSFLHILRPGFKFKKRVTGKKRFKMVYNRFIEFKENNIFTTDKEPIFYLHQKSYNNKTFWGIIALSSLADYKNDVIKKHEKTLKNREELFGNYLNVTGFNAEPVLITYPDNDLITSIYNKYKIRRSEYEFTTNKKRTHQLWLIESREDILAIEKEFDKMDSVYIADGHHRTASSLFLADKLNKEQSTSITDSISHNYFMSYLIPESILNISSFNRFITSLNNLSKEEFLMQLDARFRIENLGVNLYKPTKKHHFSMYFDGEFYKLYLRKTDYKISNSLEDLDSQILYKTILDPILGINDLTNDDRISYKPDVLNPTQIKNEVDSGKYEVGFGLFPISSDQLKLVADNRLTMPPKSTFIEPKLRTGLTIFELTGN
jgi:uncharacterized protein (DUF1015 family)